MTHQIYPYKNNIINTLHCLVPLFLFQKFILLLRNFLGLEQVPIPVINGINNEMLDFCNYSIKRVPMEGVTINTDPEFLCGCDCEDNCIVSCYGSCRQKVLMFPNCDFQDKSKCSCWKLTVEGAKYMGRDVDPMSVGYIYRRLPEQVVTGIYECNSRYLNVLYYDSI